MSDSERRGDGRARSPDEDPTGMSTKRFLSDIWPLLWETLDVGLHVSDDQGRYIYVTPSFCRILGYPAEELLGQSFDKVLPATVRQRYVEGFRRTSDEGLAKLTGDVRLLRKDGQEILANVQYHRLDTNGEPMHAYVVQDVTEQRTLEQRALQSDRISALGTLAGGVAHEFNNLLVSILGYGEMLQELDDPADLEAAQRYGRRIQRAARRGTDLTTQLLPFARRDDVGKRPVDAHDVLHEVMALFSSTAGSALSLNADLAAPRSWIIGNRIQLQQVFLNLLLNAHDAMPDGGTVEVATLWVKAPAGPTAPADEGKPAPNGYLRVRVTDQGHGMEPKVAERLFEPFFTTRADGKGLGLTLVYSSVKNHDGLVEVDSAPGRGTSIDVYLPSLPAAPKELSS